MRGVGSIRLGTVVVLTVASTSPAAAAAAAIMTVDSRWAETRAVFAPGHASNALLKTERTDGLDFAFVRGGAANFSGYNLHNRANADTHFTPTDVGLNAPFTRFTISTLDVRAGFTNSSGTATYDERRSRGHFNAAFLFTLDGPTDWSYTGERRGSDTGAGTLQFDVFIRNQANLHDHLAYRKSGDFNDSTPLSGRLDAGNYVFSFQALADVHLPDNGSGEAIVEAFENVFTLTPVPEPAGLATAAAVAAGALARRRGRRVSGGRGTR